MLLPIKLWMVNNDGVESNVAANATTKGQDGAESMAQCVKPPFIESKVTCVKLT